MLSQACTGKAAKLMTQNNENENKTISLLKYSRKFANFLNRTKTTKMRMLPHIVLAEHIKFTHDMSCARNKDLKD